MTLQFHRVPGLLVRCAPLTVSVAAATVFGRVLVIPTDIAPNLQVKLRLLGLQEGRKLRILIHKCKDPYTK